MGLSTFLACLLVVAPQHAVAQQATQPESRAPAVTKSVGAPGNLELPNVGGFKVPDEFSKFPEDLTKQLGSIKVPSNPDEVIDSLKNVRIPQPGEEIVLPTGGRFRIPTKLEAKEGVVTAPPAPTKYKFDVAPERSQRDIMNEVEAKAQAAAKKQAEEAAAKVRAEEEAAATKKRAEEAAKEQARAAAEAKAGAEKAAKEQAVRAEKAGKEKAAAEAKAAKAKAAAAKKAESGPEKAQDEDKAPAPPSEAPRPAPALRKPAADKAPAPAQPKAAPAPAPAATAVKAPAPELSEAEKKALQERLDKAAAAARAKVVKLQGGVAKAEEKLKQAKAAAAAAEAAAEAAKKAACEGQFICVKAIIGF